MITSFHSKETRRFNPIDIGRIAISNGRKIWGIAIELAHKKGVLRELGELADKLNITIVFIQVSMPKPEAETAEAIAFLDLTNSKTSPKQIKEILEKRDFVKFVKLITPSKYGFVADSHFFPLIMGDERVVVFRKEIYAGIFEGIRRKFGSAGEAFLYYVGFEAGRRAYDSYVKLASERNLEAIKEIAAAVNMTLGWAVIEDIQVNDETKTAKLRLYENFECELRRNSKEAYSQFYKGAVAGVFTGYFQEEMKAEETKCIAKGDPYCEFSVSKSSP